MSTESIPNDVRDRIESTGGSYFVLESTWWGSEKFGTWGERFTGQVEAETDDAVLFEDVKTFGGKRVGSGWVPKSKLDKRVDAPEPENHVIFQAGEEPEMGKASEADYQISDTGYYRGRYRDYLKYVVDFEYSEELKENFKREDDDQWWEDYHPSAKFDNEDNFQEWRIDGDISLTNFAEQLAGDEYSVAVHAEFLQ